MGYQNGRGQISKWAWSEVQTAQLMVSACVRLQLQNMEDKSRGTTQTCTAKSNEGPLRSGCAGVVKVTLTLYQKALRHALRCPLYSTLGIKMVHMHGC